MAASKTVWGIDIGQCALKALKIREIDGQLKVVAFDIIEHSSILSKGEVGRDELIQNSLMQFLERNNTTGSAIVVGVPGQTSFTRFIKLPPVDKKRIPEIVRFEAEQQIPFPINDVVWRWQTFQDPDNPDVELGIFAMKKVDVDSALAHFNEVGMTTDCVQMAPLALYNFMTFDDQLVPDGATLLADVGVDKTDLVVADGARIWTRTIQIGGSDFTEALVRAFKLPFNKAEKLKRSAATSKYARQIFQAMRPVFADLVQEIQRSIGYYTSLHRKTRFKKLIGMGNGFRLPGLQKYLEQNLNTPVAKIDTFNNLTTADDVNTPAFTEDILSFAVAYGLAVQGLGISAVETNLLPTNVFRKRLWAKKRPYWVAAAVLLIATSWFYMNSWAKSYASITHQTDPTALRLVEKEKQEINSQRIAHDKEVRIINEGKDRTDAKSKLKLFAFSNYKPSVMTLISKSVAFAVDIDNPSSHQYIYRQSLRIQEAGVIAKDEESRAKAKEDAEDFRNKLAKIPRNERRLLFLQTLQEQYSGDLSKYDRKGLSRYIDVLLGKARPGDDNPVGPMPGNDNGTGTSQSSEDEKKIERGFIVTVIGSTPAQILLAESILRRVKDKSFALAKGKDMSSLSLKGFQIGFDQPKAALLRGRVQKLANGDATPGLGGGMHIEIGDQPGVGPKSGDEDKIDIPDEMFAGEDAIDDRFFVAVWVFTIDGDGVSESDETDESSSDSRR